MDRLKGFYKFYRIYAIFLIQIIADKKYPGINFSARKRAEPPGRAYV